MRGPRNAQRNPDVGAANCCGNCRQFECICGPWGRGLMTGCGVSQVMRLLTFYPRTAQSALRKVMPQPGRITTSGNYCTDRMTRRQRLPCRILYERAWRLCAPAKFELTAAGITSCLRCYAHQPPPRAPCPADMRCKVSSMWQANAWQHRANFYSSIRCHSLPKSSQEPCIPSIGCEATLNPRKDVR